IDRLAKRGMLFTHAYCAAPLCNPSRIALITGLRPSTTGVYGNLHRFRNFIPDAITLPQYFKTNGYQVLGGGKIFDVANQSSDPRSWDEYFPIPENDVKAPRDPDAKKKPFAWGPMKADDDQMSDMKIANWAIRHLQEKSDKPLFLAVGFFKPHIPLYVPQKYFDMHPLESIQLPSVKENDLDDLPPTGQLWADQAPGLKPGAHQMILTNGLWKSAVQAYLATCSFSDACVGRVLDAFDKSPYATNTIVVLWSDHGWHLGEKSHWQKHVLWEEATHAPLMFVVPGLTKPNQRCERVVSFLDIYPTMTDLCDLPTPKAIEGVSFISLLKNSDAKWDRPAIITYGPNNHAVRTEQWRYIRYHTGDEELYDETKDKKEWFNLAAKPEFAPVKKQLAAMLPKVNVPDTLRNSDFNKKPHGKYSTEGDGSKVKGAEN
ncbi:MAG: Choline-sulfatase, partial [Verrucomicrobiales bacterium]|nr:Choline-sulfatase [Verrucomicrobiales bacterium]